MNVENTEVEKPRVYFARGVDGLDWAKALRRAASLSERLSHYNIDLVDPVALGGGAGVLSHEKIVENDLTHLRSCDGLLMDMSIPNRTYIGCCCELTYAFLWSIPSVVYVGQTGNEGRPWLRYHASAVCQTESQAIKEIVDLILDTENKDQ